MALVFPSNPSVNDTYQVNGRTYVWNGTSWRTVKGGVPDVVPTLSVDNDFSAGGTLHIDSTNNEIGIGTAAPSHQLHLTQDLGVDGNLIVGGTITVPTPVAGTNDTKVATTAFVGDAVSTAVSGLLDGAPAALDTLNELAAALDDDENYASTITTALAGKLDSSSYTAADVLAKLLTVDGAGSSLDADTLDGSHASAFAGSVHTHSYLPLSGGTLTGAVTTSSNIIFSGDSYIQFEGSSADGFETFLRATNPTADRTIYLPNAGGTLSLDGHTHSYAATSHTHSYAATSHTHSYVPTSGGSVTGNFTAQGDLYVGKDGGGDSNAFFYDDNNNTWRTLQWDDSFNDWRVEDNGGTMRTLWHSGNISPLSTSGGTVSGLLEVSASKNSEIRIRSTFNGNWTAGDGFGHLTFYSNDTSGTGAGIRARLSAVARDTYGLETDVKIFSMSAGSYAERIRIGAYGFVAFGNGLSPSERIHASGNILVTGTGYKPGGGSWTASSDERLKKNIETYNSGLSTLRQLNPVTFVWDCDDIDDSGKVQVGVLAQEIETVWPDWVDTIENRSYVRNSDGQELTNTKAVSFKNDFNVMVISAIKELAERIEALEAN